MKQVVGSGSDLTVHVGLRTGDVDVAEEGSPRLRQTWVIFNVYDAGGVHRGAVEASAEDVGVPLDATRAVQLQRDDTAYRLPLHVSAAVASLCVPETRIWIAIDQPVQYLPVVPWETLFTRSVGVPTFRLLRSALRPVGRGDLVDVALCISVPAERVGVWGAEEVVELFLAMLPRSATRRARLHVFADAVSRRIIAKSMQRLEQTVAEVIPYEPKVGTAYLDEQSVAPEGVWAMLDRVQRGIASAVGRRDRSGVSGIASTVNSLAPALLRIDNPWLQWMFEALRDRIIDYVHVVTHGSLGPETGGLRFVSPIATNDKRWTRPVTARELNALLLGLGSWSIGFSSPPGNASVAGLRYLVHELGMIRTGPVLLHDMTQDTTRDTLVRAYRYYQDSADAPDTQAVTIVANPRAATGSLPNDSDLLQYTLAELLNTEFAGKDPPKWLLTAQRLLEESATALESDATGEYDDAVKRGIGSTLLYTRDTLAKIAASNIPSHEGA